MCLNTSKSKCNLEEKEHLLRNLVRAGRILLPASFSGTPGFDEILADFAFPPSPPGQYIIINNIILQSQVRIIFYYRVIPERTIFGQLTTFPQYPSKDIHKTSIVSAMASYCLENIERSFVKHPLSCNIALVMKFWNPGRGNRFSAAVAGLLENMKL